MNSGLVDVDALLQEASDLQPLPASATRIAGLVADPESKLADIGEAVRFDEALTGRLLGAANSVAFGARATIATVDDAILRLGTGRVLALVVAGFVAGSMNRALPAYGLDEGQLWRHSVASALAIERSGRYGKRPVRPEAFAVALLHDVGKLVLARHLRADHVASIRRMQDDGVVDLDEAERSVVAVGHAQLGARIARHWQLPESIALGIEHHHSPLCGPDEESRLLCAQVQLADAVAAKIGHSCGDGHIGGFTPALAGSLGMTIDAFDELCVDVERRLDDVLESYEA